MKGFLKGFPHAWDPSTAMRVGRTGCRLARSEVVTRGTRATSSKAGRLHGRGAVVNGGPKYISTVEECEGRWTRSMRPSTSYSRVTILTPYGVPVHLKNTPKIAKFVKKYQTTPNSRVRPQTLKWTHQTITYFNLKSFGQVTASNRSFKFKAVIIFVNLLSINL